MTMGRTYYHTTKADDGSEIEVEFAYSHGSETTYSPRFGADGGDSPEVEIRTAYRTADPADAPNVTLTDAENERIEGEIYANPPEPDYGEFD